MDLLILCTSYHVLLLVHLVDKNIPDIPAVSESLFLVVFLALGFFVSYLGCHIMQWWCPDTGVGPVHIFIPVYNSQLAATGVLLCIKDNTFVMPHVEDIVEAFNVECVHGMDEVFCTLVDYSRTKSAPQQLNDHFTSQNHLSWFISRFRAAAGLWGAVLVTILIVDTNVVYGRTELGCIMLAVANSISHVCPDGRRLVFQLLMPPVFLLPLQVPW